MTAPASLAPMPDAAGFFGPYGGQLVPPHLKQAMDDINAAYAQITQREDFQQELGFARSPEAGHAVEVRFEPAP